MATRKIVRHSQYSLLSSLRYEPRHHFLLKQWTGFLGIGSLANIFLQADFGNLVARRGSSGYDIDGWLSSTI